MAAAWAVMGFLGRAGYRRIGETVMRTRARLEEGLAQIEGDLAVWGRPELWASGARAASSGTTRGSKGSSAVSPGVQLT